ncbi:MAG: ribokinase [bacterium]|nr:ribokinase [bacterium]
MADSHARRARVVVIGACNMDLVSYVPRFPQPGETLHGTRFITSFGGKGANQAVMAAKLGAEVWMVGKVGRDVFGEDMLKNFRCWGVHTTYVYQADGVASGVAPIAVDAEGRNAIIIVTGANDQLTCEEVTAACSVIAQADVVVGQLEIPLEPTLAALRAARDAGVRTIFNPAPARPSLPAACYELSDLFCPNEHEAALLTGMPVETLAQCEAAARALLARGPRGVILTLGARGSLLVDPTQVVHVPARQVRAVDTTGAGDAFIGSLACLLGEGWPLGDAVRVASAIATQSVLAPGAQSSFPTRAELVAAGILGREAPE